MQKREHYIQRSEIYKEARCSGKNSNEEEGLTYKNGGFLSSLDVTSDWYIMFDACGVSLKGNTYWFAIDKYRERRSTVEIVDFLICYDFTT